MNKTANATEQPQQLVLLGDDERDLAKMPHTERVWVDKLRALELSPRFWECFEKLRGQRYPVEQALAGAWYSLGIRARGKYTTVAAFAELIGRSRQTVQNWLSTDSELRAAAIALRAEFWTDRIQDIDEATYNAALRQDANAADRKLAYQRAGVRLTGEEGEGVDPWQDVLAQARRDAEADTNGKA